MSYGNMTVFVGPMFSGKSSHLLQQHIWKNHAGDSSLLVKPAFDDRYATEEVVTHNNLKVTAVNVTSVDDINRIILRDGEPTFKNLMIDECQFFIEPHFHGNIVECVKNLLKNQINIYAAGLDMDWRGDPFYVSAMFLAMADDAVKLKSVCSKSGKPATKTYKKTKSGESIELGEKDLYEVRHNDYWS